MIELYILANGITNRIELYDDEKITLTSSVQDISDIGKAKTDFTQNFTIPANDHNNAIFKHWYENAINDGYDQRIKYDGFIEIDTLPFRKGGFALNSVAFKNNLPESYSVTFYGETKNIKDIVKEDKIGSLDYESLNHPFTYEEVVTNRVVGTITNVGYPLFAYNRFFTYDDATPTDVTTNAGRIEWNKLFPAVRVSRILKFIEIKYNIAFSGSFLLTPHFERLFMLFRNSEEFNLSTEPQIIDFTAKDPDLLDAELNLTTNEIGLAFRQQQTALIQNRDIEIEIAPSFSATPYNVFVYRNDTIEQFLPDLTGTQTITIFDGDLNPSIINDKWRVFVQSTNPLNFNATLFYNIIQGGITDTQIIELQGTGEAQSIVNTVNIGSYAPDLKVIDFLTAIIKMFNLVVIPRENSFELIPLENYYINGKFNDITEYVISDDIEIRKTSMYKNIEFNYQKSEARSNKAFDDQFLPLRSYAYGDLKYEQIDSLESATLKIDLPFENPIYRRIGDFQFLEFMKEDGTGYVNKPLLMYLNGVQPISPGIQTEFGALSNYNRYSNDFFNGQLSSLNWGAEVSQWAGQIANDSLYRRRYENYLSAIFDIKGRLKIVKCHFEPTQLMNIQLNDRIILRDKRYTINKFTAELTTGDVTFELLTDFRSINQRIAFSDQVVYRIPTVATKIEVQLLMSGAKEINLIFSDEDFIKYNPDTFTDDAVIQVEINTNATGNTRIGYIQGNWDGQLVKIPIIQEG